MGLRVTAAAMFQYNATPKADVIYIHTHLLFNAATPTVLLGVVMLAT